MFRLFFLSSVIALMFTILSCDSSSSKDEGQTTTANPKEFVNIFEHVDVRAFNEIIRRKDVILIDVRTPREYAEGHIKNAQNMNLYDSDFDEKILQFDPSKTYLFYSRSEHRSHKAMDRFRAKQFFKLYDLTGGIKAWERAGMDVIK